MSRIIEIIDSDEDIQCAVTSVANNVEDSPQSQSRRRPRKSTLQNLPDPEVQFETIAVDDDTDSRPLEDNTTSLDSSVARPQQKHLKATPNILAPKPPSNAEIVEAAFEEFLAEPETKETIEAIALERVRINHMLMLFGMPDIIFSLYTQPELLKFQFEERLKQQKILQNRTGVRGQGV